MPFTAPPDAQARMIGKGAEIYEKLSADREQWLEAGERFSALTTPSVLPPDDEPVPSRRVIPHNGTGSQGVNTLSSKMAHQLIPPQQAFFRMEVKADSKRALDAAAASAETEVSQQAQKIQTEIKARLVELEGRLVQELGRDNLRANAVEAFKHLLVVGNVVLHLPDRGRTAVHTLRNFVVKRDPAGNILHMVIKERMAEVAAPEAVRVAANLGIEFGAPQDPQPGTKADDHLCIYTVMERVGESTFEVWQEVNATMVGGTHKSYAEDQSPFIVLRWTETPGEDYGHAFVGDYEGDLLVLEALTRAIKEGAVAASRIIHGVSPEAPPGLERRLSQAENGDYLRFDENHIHTVQLDKFQDLRIAAQTADEAQQRLRQAFLLNTTRDAERVTAEEIRQNFHELQESLGGAFAQLANTFQVPLLQRLMIRLKARGGLSGLEDALESTEPIIITGVDALGRNTEMNNLLAFSTGLQQMVGPQAAAGVLDPTVAAKRLANATSVNPEGLIISQEQFQQQRQAAAAEEAMVKAAPGVAQEATKAATQGQ